MEDDLDNINKELQVLKNELNFILKEDICVIFNDLTNQISIILEYLTKSNERPVINNTLLANQSKLERLNLVAPNGLEGIKCALTINAHELSNIEINYKPTTRHNNYIYKSKEDLPWHIYQIVNCGDTLKALVSYINTLNMPLISLDQAIFHVQHLLDEMNSARNILLFPKKRHITELQSQKNMKIFPLVPSDLVFSFYMQGFKLILAIYVIKGNDTSKYILETPIPWLNNVMILLTSCLQKLQQLKDKLKIFEIFTEEQMVDDKQNFIDLNNEEPEEICTFHL